MHVYGERTCNYYSAACEFTDQRLCGIVYGLL